MNQEIKDRWVRALRSGEYRQGRGNLRGIDESYCCLGVLCDLAAQDGIGQWREPEEKYSTAFIFQDHPDPDAERTPYGEDRSPSVLTARVVAWAGVPDMNPDVTGEFRIDGLTRNRSTLAGVNDNDGDFDRIADLIDQQL